MRNVGRKLAFVLAAANHGTMIVNRFDYRMSGPNAGIGVGFQVLETGCFDPIEVELALQLLEARKRFHGPGVVAIDCGANIGVHTVEWATAMTGWGSVVAIEAQERIYYALAGNIAINNCFNAVAMHAAVSSEAGIMNVPVPDYFTPSSFGSLELKPRAQTEFIGQPIDYSDGKTVPVQKISIDAMALPRVDLIKIDVEGMEMEALAGAAKTIERDHPILLVETIKIGRDTLRAFLEGHGYKVADAGINLLAIHKSDPVADELQVPEQTAKSTAA
jgi:FkbM family methyltransferase